VKKYVKPFSWVVVRKLGNREVVSHIYKSTGERVSHQEDLQVLEENLLHVLQGCQDLCSLNAFSQFTFLRHSLLYIASCLL